MARLLLAIAMLFASITVAQAANIWTFKDGNNNSHILRFTGKIVKGDFARIQQVYLENRWRNIYWVSLDSGGGDVKEAQQIGRWIRTMGLNTFVGNNSECASACTDIYIGGKDRAAWVGASFGFHPSSNDWDPGTSLDAAFDSGQMAALDDAFHLLLHVDAGKEFVALRFMRNVYSKTYWYEMYWANLTELKNAGIVKRIWR